MLSKQIEKTILRTDLNNALENKTQNHWMSQTYSFVHLNFTLRTVLTNLHNASSHGSNSFLVTIDRCYTRK